jgi:hypothetical protein
MSTPDNELVELRRRVASEPNNLQYHFELGVALSSRHDHAAAIAELHQATRSPQFRLRAMGLLAEAFDARGMHDMAARMREQSGDEGDSGSAPLPVPKRPLTPHDSAGAEKIPDEDDHAA